MHEEESMQRFIVCKRRNVAAAYERFLGPSAGALDDEPWHSRTWNGLIRILRIPAPWTREARAGEPLAALPSDRPA